MYLPYLNGSKIPDATLTNLTMILSKILLLDGNDGLIFPNYNIYTIKENLIKYYETIFNNPNYPDANLIINNDTKLFVVFNPSTYSEDDVSKGSVYSLIVKHNITIKLQNLSPIINKGDDPTKLKSLENLTGLIYDKKNNYIYTYQNEIVFPMALKFNIPKKLDNGSADPSDATWYNNIQTYLTTIYVTNNIQNRKELLLSGIDTVNTIMKSMNSIKDDTNRVSQITDIFSLYLPADGLINNNTGKYYFVMLMNNPDSTTGIYSPYIIHVDGFENSYAPNFCTDATSVLYNNKCLPSCPTGYTIDTGLTCFKSDITNFTPDSDFCAVLTSSISNVPKNSILQGLLDSCNSDNINNVAQESLFNIKDIKGLVQVKSNTNEYILNPDINHISVKPNLQANTSSGTDSTIDNTSFTNVQTQHFNQGNIKTLGNFQRYPERFSAFYE